jgi:hypothetical protein
VRFLKGLITTNEGRSEIGGLFVLGGLVLEVWLAFRFRSPDKSFLEEWGPIIADTFVAGGVFIELYFGRKASNESAERVSQANERAAKAELETEKLRAQFSWRRLSAEQIRKFLDALADKARLSIHITYTGDDPEANTFAREIGALFKKSGWNVGFTSASYAGEVAFGVRLPLYAPPNLDACAIARIALSAASIEYSGAEAPKWFMGNGSGDSVTSACALLYVGPKPAPSPESSETNSPTEATRMSPEEAKNLTEQWRSRLQDNEPITTWPIDAPLTITREDDGTLVIDCRNFRLAGMDEVGTARFRISPDAVNALSQYFLSLEKRGDDKQ